jgi:hypothetical protein
MQETSDTIRATAPSPIIFTALENINRDPSRITKSTLRAVLSFAFLPIVNDVPIPDAVAAYAAAIVYGAIKRLGIELPANCDIAQAEQIEQVVRAANVPLDDRAISKEALLLMC